MRPIVIFVVALSFAAPLEAHEPLKTVTAEIAVADLDLASARGQRVLARRIAGAVEQVCGSYSNAPETADQDRIRDCRAVAMSDAHRQIALRRPTHPLAA